jgi:hypothetical protein
MGSLSDDMFNDRATASGWPVSGGAGAEPLPAPEGSVNTSLEHSETSVAASPVTAFLQAGPEPTTTLQIFDETSWSARYRHAGWATHRRRVWQSLQRTGQASSRLASFGSCGSLTTVERSELDDSRFRLRCNHCHDRLCTPCANGRSWRLQQALMSQFTVDGALFITLTLCGKKESLTDLIDRLYRSFRNLRQHPTWADKIKGGAAFLEIKWSDKAQRWHPHLHIVAQGGFVAQYDLSDAWRSITKDSYIVDIRRIRDKEHAARYVTKYASKPLNSSFGNTPKLLDEAVIALKGRRLCLCFGTWYGTALDLADDETLADDVVDAGGWTFVGSLEDFLIHAASGDEWHRQALIAAGAEAAMRLTWTTAPPSAGDYAGESPCGNTV